MVDQFKNRPNTVNTAMANLITSRIDFSIKPVPLQEILSQVNPSGEPVEMMAIVGKHITVWQINPFATDLYGPAAFVVFTTDEGELCNMVVGQSVVVTKFLMAIDQLPFDCTITTRKGGTNAVYYDVK